jgi:MarR family transcriptional regulator, organic hydroperoxide resistance regulator
MDGQADQDPLSEEISSLFNRAAFRLKDHQFACLERFKLNAIQANALWRIGPRESVSVGALADRFWADPSNLAAPLEALKKRGLLTRTPAAHDRRVRTVRLTAEGRALRKRLMACLFTEPPVVAALTPRERRAFRDLLAKLDLEL